VSLSTFPSRKSHNAPELKRKGLPPFNAYLQAATVLLNTEQLCHKQGSQSPASQQKQAVSTYYMDEVKFYNLRK
jgi:hypothetical protein